MKRFNVGTRQRSVGDRLIIIGVCVLLIAFLATWIAQGRGDTTVSVIASSKGNESLSNTSFSGEAISDQVESQISRAIASAVPEVDDLYVRRMSDGGLSITGTASLLGYSDSYAVAANLVSRFLITAYRDLPGIRVDYAELYAETNGRYIMAAGLGRSAARNLVLTAFAPDQGSLLAHDLAAVNRYQAPLQDEAFAEYANPITSP